MLSIRKTHDLTHTWIASSFETLFAQIKTLRRRAVTGPAAADPYSSYLSYLSHTIYAHYLLDTFFFFLSLSSSIVILAFFHITFSLLDSFAFRIHARSHIIFLYVLSFFLAYRFGCASLIEFYRTRSFLGRPARRSLF